MIIVRYLVWETLKTQAAILFVLSLIFFCQKLTKILSAAINGEIPSNLILSLLGFGIPEMIQFILPLSLSLGILITFGKLYAESKIIVMHACGLGKSMLIQTAMILALLTGIITMVNVMWVGPWSSRRSDEILARAKANQNLVHLTQGKFQRIHSGNSVLFIEKVHNNYFHNVFFAQLHHRDDVRPLVVVADSGKVICSKNGSQVIILNKGTCFEGTAKLHDFRITDFQNYQAIIDHDIVTINSNNTWQMDMSTLWNTNSNYANTEINWRITLIFTVFMMALMVVPMSVVNPRQRQTYSIVLTMLLYLVFFVLQTFIRSSGNKGKLNPMFWMWMINSFYLLLAVLLNLWNTVPMRRIRTDLYLICKRIL